MRQELIDLLRGELDPEAADALGARLSREPELARELCELEALFGLLRRGEEIDASPEVRAALLAAAERATAPTALQQIAALPGLVRYRFRNSLGFRVAAISLSAHLLVMVILLQVTWVNPSDRIIGLFDWGVVDDGPAVHVPSRSFAARLTLRRLGAESLQQFGVDGQGEAILRGLDALAAEQEENGSFGDVGETGYAALAFLARGGCSTHNTRDGRVIAVAVRHILAEAEAGAAVHGAALTALIEDWTLAYHDLDDFERARYERTILAMIRDAGSDEASQEALALAEMAGFAIPAGRDLGEARALLEGGREALLASEPTRLTATIVLAKGQTTLDPGRVREWVLPLFRRAMREVEGGRAPAVALLTLQAPYRL